MKSLACRLCTQDWSGAHNVIICTHVQIKAIVINKALLNISEGVDKQHKLITYCSCIFLLIQNVPFSLVLAVHDCTKHILIHLALNSALFIYLRKIQRESHFSTDFLNWTQFHN